MLPEQFVIREKTLLGDRFELLFHYPYEQPRQGITVNRLRNGAMERLQGLGIPFEKSLFSDTGLICPEGMKLSGNHPFHKAGLFYIQEPSATAPAALLDIQPGDVVLDMCAAPGGKSTQLAGALDGCGLLVCNEYDRNRSMILAENMERIGAPNVVVLNEEPQNIADLLPGYFNKVLVDAPCSGEGMFRKEAEASSQYSQALVEHCAALGKQILDCAASCLKPGGILVYSTCTFSPEEDEQQVRQFLARHSDFELCKCSCTFGAEGEENRCEGDKGLAGSVRRIWPCHGGEGHFMAKLLYRGNDICSRGKPKKSNRKVPAKTLSLWHSFCEEYFPQLKASVPVLYGKNLILEAADMPSSLHVIRNGVAAGILKGERFEPSHHLFMVYGSQCENREELKQLEQAYSYLRGEELPAVTSKPGWCCITIGGYPLGFGKTSGSVVKNHLPKGLRNLK